jgi:hypothetical protein
VEVDLGGEAWDELEVYLHAYGSSYEPQTCKVEARMGGAGGELKTVAIYAGSTKLAKSGGWTSVGKADASTAGATSLRFSNHESDGGSNIKLAGIRVKARAPEKRGKKKQRGRGVAGNGRAARAAATTGGAGGGEEGDGAVGSGDNSKFVLESMLTSASVEEQVLVLPQPELALIVVDAVASAGVTLPHWAAAEVCGCQASLVTLAYTNSSCLETRDTCTHTHKRRKNSTHGDGDGGGGGVYYC